MINKRKFDSLSVADRSALMAAAKESEIWLKPKYEKFVDDSIAEAIKEGGTVSALPAAKRQQTVDAIAAKWRVEVDKDCGPDLSNKVRALFAKNALK